MYTNYINCSAFHTSIFAEFAPIFYVYAIAVPHSLMSLCFCDFIATHTFKTVVIPFMLFWVLGLLSAMLSFVFTNFARKLQS